MEGQQLQPACSTFSRIPWNNNGRIQDGSNAESPHAGKIVNSEIVRWLQVDSDKPTLILTYAKRR